MPAVSMDVMEEHVEEIMHFTGAVWKANVGDDPELVDRKVAPSLHFHFATPPEGSPAVAHAMKAPAPPLP